MGKRKIQKTIKIFAERAKKNLKAEKVILFGSYARGEANEYSDVDVIVLSKIFEKIPEEKRLDLLYPLTRGLFPDVHPFGFTSEEFNNISKTSTLFEARVSGLVVS